jgi:6-phosphogluconate dehydrogenase
MTDRIGIVGIGTMGRNLALNIADKGFSVIGYDKDLNKVNLLNQQSNPFVKAVSSLREFVHSLEKPRIILILVPAGSSVDEVIQNLLPFLNPGDILVDGGNSHFVDTNRRQKALREIGLSLIGMGISGGEEGARFGPSLMPGGTPEAYEKVKDILEAIAARVDDQPCVSNMGSGSAGHYVKMVHNGIEYGLMQIIAESYGILKSGLNFNDDELYQIYRSWNQGKLNSFLMEITAQIFLKKDEKGERLIHVILDVAEQEGTGMWTSQNAMELHVPIPIIDMAVSLRDLSALKYQWKLDLHQKLKGPSPAFNGNRDNFLKQLENAVYMGFILTFEHGMTLFRVASDRYHYHLNLETIARIWRGGCINRCALLEQIMKAYQRNPYLNTLLQDAEIEKELSDLQVDLRSVVCAITKLGLSIPALSASISYYDAYRHSSLPTNLIQAQRDYFGAHTYKRVDQPGSFHTDWGLSAKCEQRYDEHQ